MEEIWKEVKGFEHYFVSNLGELWNTRTNNKTFGTQEGNKYLRFSLRDNGRINFGRAHRFVAVAFIPNPENKQCVNHINGVKTDNSVENLEWVSHSENTRHAIKSGLLRITGEDNYKTKFTESDILTIRKLYHSLSQEDIALQFKTTREVIKNIANGKSWKYLPLENYTERTIVRKKKRPFVVLKKRLPSEVVNSVRELIKKGVYQIDIAKALNISLSSVGRINRCQSHFEDAGAAS